MKKVVLLKMLLLNFKGHKNLEINFSDRTTISGDNRLGKSTIMDAFLWNMNGKDQFDRKDYEIIPIVDEKRVDKVDSEVVNVFNIEGSPVTLRRVLHQKWVRRRGTAEEVFDGCETLYYINEVPKKAGEYKAFVDSIVDETVFKLITNPSAFLSLHWTKQREFLFQIAGTVSDAEVLDRMANLSNKDAVLNITNLLNSGKSLVDFKKELSARKKKLKSDLDDIQPKIDQTTKLMPESKDFEAIEKEIAAIDLQIKAIDEQIGDKAKAIRGQFEEIQRKQGEINSLKTKQGEVVNAEKVKANQSVFNDNLFREGLKNEITAAEAKVKTAKENRDNSKSHLEDLNKKYSTVQGEIDELTKAWYAEGANEYIPVDDCVICPLAAEHKCVDASILQNKAQSQELAKTSFYETKSKNINRIADEGKAKTAGRTELEGKIKEAEQLLEERENSLKSGESTLSDANEKLKLHPEATPIEVVAEQLEEWKELESQIKAIQLTIQEVAPVETSELNGKKAGLIVSRDILKKSLSDRDLIIKHKAEIKQLEEQASSLAQQIADAENEEFQIDAFNKVKIDECEKRVNSMFQIVKFQLFDKTNDGNEFEACIPLNKAGVPISATNTAEKINAGLDIINVLSKFFNVSAPVFCDGAESNNNYLSTESQIAFLRVTNEKSLTIQ